MNPEFKVYDNMETFNKHNIDDGKKETRLTVKDMWIKPPHNAFWFSTDMNREERNVDIYAAHLHLHIGTFLPSDRLQYDDKKLVPILVLHNWMWYDPKIKALHVRNSIFPWKEPLWTKHTKYYGSEIPVKKCRVLGKCIFNYHTEEISFILNLYPSRKISYDEKLKLKSS